MGLIVDYQSANSISCIFLKWLSRVTSIRLYCLLRAAIQISFSGMGVPALASRPDLPVLFRSGNSWQQYDRRRKKVFDFVPVPCPVGRQVCSTRQFTKHNVRQVNMGMGKIRPDNLVALEKRNDDGSVEQSITTVRHLSFHNLP